MRNEQRIGNTALYPPELPWQPPKSAGTQISANEAKFKIVLKFFAKRFIRERPQ